MWHDLGQDVCYVPFFNNELSYSSTPTGPVLVEILPPIPTTGLTKDDVTDLTEKTRNLMLESFDRLNKEVENMK